jgi:hypothetical protein
LLFTYRTSIESLPLLLSKMLHLLLQLPYLVHGFLQLLVLLVIDFERLLLLDQQEIKVLFHLDLLGLADLLLQVGGLGDPINFRLLQVISVLLLEARLQLR